MTSVKKDPLEVARVELREEAERLSLRVLAGRIGINHSTLSQFLDGTVARPRVAAREAILAYMKRRSDSSGNEKPATSETGGLGAGTERSKDYWLGYWESRQDTLHEVLGLVHGLTGQLHEMNKRALAMHQAIRTHTIPTPRADLTPEQLEQAETAYRLLAEKETAEREPAGDAEHPTPPAGRPSRRRAGGSGK